MKHIIRRVEYITGDIRTVFKGSIESDNIERTRKELHEQMACDRVILVYDSVGGK